MGLIYSDAHEANVAKKKKIKKATQNLSKCQYKNIPQKGLFQTEISALSQLRQK